jgi:hypothetical protein
VFEKRIWHEKSVRHGQRATLVGLQRNFLCQHDVACDEVNVGAYAVQLARRARLRSIATAGTKDTGCAGVIIRQQIALCIGLAEGGG